VTSRELLDRIAALVALASSPSVEEARTAAHKACAMMREHGVTIGFEEDGSLVTRSVVAVAPDRPAPRRAPERKTVIIFRCSHCGRRLLKQGAACQACVEMRSPLGVWTVDCQGCGRSTPPGRSELEVNEIALHLGFRVTDDGITFCPRCFARQRSTG
jgi:hypothetical protein